MSPSQGLPDDVAQTLRDARRVHGVTLVEVAVDAGVTVAYVSNVLLGRVPPTWPVARALVDALPSLPADVVEALACAVGRRPAIDVFEVLATPTRTES